MSPSGADRGPEGRPVLSIVIPVLNEEQAIGGTLQRCLDARRHIIGHSPVGEVEILVVNDGSKDRSEEIALGFPEVTVLSFERNRGYGAAIQAGFAHGRGDWVGFLDGDGTCDPRFFADLCHALEERSADLVLGSRMGDESEMPWIRTLGNTLFAWTLGLLSRRPVGDVASGMRVLRRSALPDLYPLPDGLHFTPAMSARVLLEGKLRLAELPMPYAERTGRSKLSVVRDGLRFLRAILQAALAFRPARPLLLGAAVLGALAVGLTLDPLGLYVRSGRLEEWMIYRLLLASLLATACAVLASTAVIADRIAEVAHVRERSGGFTRLVQGLFSRRWRAVAGGIFAGLSLWLVFPGAVEYGLTGHVTMHWSRAALASLILVLAMVHGLTTFLLHMMTLIQAQRAKPVVQRPDRVRVAVPPPAGPAHGEARELRR